MWTVGSVGRAWPGAAWFCLLAFGIVLAASAARGESLQDEQCRNALNSFIASGWNAEKLAPDQCPEDIRLYMSFLASIRMDGSDANIQKQQQSLLAAADAGNRSAEILYTLLFTSITDSKFLTKISSESSYSRYSTYIRSWDVLVKIPDMVKYQVRPAIADGVVEIYIPYYLATYLEWRYRKWPNDRIAAAAYLLIAAAFYSDQDAVRTYLRRLLSMDDSEMQEADRFAAFRVAEVVARKEVSHCQYDKRCATDSNLKRLICDIRTPEGDVLLRLDAEICDRLSAPLVALYRSSVIDMMAAIIKPR